MRPLDRSSRVVTPSDLGGPAVKLIVAIGACFTASAEARGQYVAAVEAAMDTASRILFSEGIEVDLESVILDTAAGRSHFKKMSHALELSSCLLLDISEAPSLAHYQLGYCDAADIPSLVLVRREAIDSRQENDLVPGALIYDDEAQLSDLLAVPLSNKIKEALAGRRISPFDRDLVWFPAGTEAVHIVASRSTDQLYSAHPDHRNHVYLEQFSDKDSVLELMVFLSRNYDARIHKYTSEEFPEKQLLRDNLVVVGGPGVDDVLPGNPICRGMSQQLRTRVTYAPDGESLTLQTGDGLKEIRPKYDGDRLLKDFGYFARFPNPFEPTASVVMVHGLHTAGVLGACLAFSDHPHAAINFQILRRALSSHSKGSVSFEALVAVERVGGAVMVPKLCEDWVFELEGQRR